MPRNGSGTFSLAAGNPVVNGTTIDPTWANGTLSDMATALTQSIAADGQTPVTANIPMNGKKLTGLGAATTSGDALSYGQSVNGTDAAFTGLTVTGNASITGTTTAKGVAIVATKTVNTSRSSTTTLADDPHLSVSLSSGTWAISGILMFYGTTTGTQSIKFFPSVSAVPAASGLNLSGYVNTAVMNGNLSMTAFNTSVMPSPISTSSAAPDYVNLSGFIVVATPGTLTIQWAQSSSSANATNLLAGSSLICTKVG